MTLQRIGVDQNPQNNLTNHHKKNQHSHGTKPIRNEAMELFNIKSSLSFILAIKLKAFHERKSRTQNTRSVLSLDFFMDSAMHLSFSLTCLNPLCSLFYLIYLLTEIPLINCFTYVLSLVTHIPVIYLLSITINGLKTA